jgi:quinol-cytochrome oxidoreductase complex cytochrome b subunit
MLPFELFAAARRGAQGAWLKGTRSFHRCSSNGVLLLMLIHLARVLFTGAHLRPREMTWATGLGLALSTSAAGVTGYTLPWDQLGFWAFQIVSALPASLDFYAPVDLRVGAFLVCLLRGGPTLGQAALSRCFVAHTLLVLQAILQRLGALALCGEMRGLLSHQRASMILHEVENES